MYLITMNFQTLTKTFLNDEECEKNLDVSDRKNLEDGFISISPIKIDMHANAQQKVVADWAKNLQIN